MNTTAAVVAVVASLMSGVAGAQTVAVERQMASGSPVSELTSDVLRPSEFGTRHIVVSIPDRKLAVIEDGRVIKIYRIAVGARVSPSPSGEFRIINRITNPGYYHPHKVILGGKNNPLGTRWIGLDRAHYGIHGTNEPASIGHALSHGCIRMRNRDVEEFFQFVRVGDRVEIHAERDGDVAELFSGAIKDAHSESMTASTSVAVNAAGGGQ